ncbi:MAG: endonuclease/exonuclease/phosphatase family protein [Hyphomonadaceae bacterium]|nr:endonuclease/exonuclease/phosphatase family protein [Hyphomonadaceae bacterium]
MSLAIYVGGAFSSRLDVFAGATPLLVAVGLLVSAVAHLSGAHRLAIGALLAMAPAGAIVSAELLGAPRPPSPPSATTLKILSLNMHAYNFRVDEIAQLIIDENPDIVLLQESQYGGRWIGEAMQERFPTRITNYRHCSTQILSRLRLVETFHNEDCTAAVARLAVPSVNGDAGILVASVHVPRASRPAAILHSRMTQWAHESAIVGGDFNRTPWSWALRRFDGIQNVHRRTRALPTWPTQRAWPRGKRFAFPFLPIDHIYATSDWTTVSVRRGRDVGSDHYPVIVELARRPPQPGAANGNPQR